MGEKSRVGLGKRLLINSHKRISHDRCTRNEITSTKNIKHKADYEQIKLEWKCEQCTSTNLMIARKCTTCGVSMFLVFVTLYI